MNRQTFFGLAAAALLVSACAEGPTAGELVFELQTPNTDDGAISFTVTADSTVDVISVAADCGGCRVFAHVVNAQTLKGIVVGDVVAGPVVRVSVSDVRDPVLFRATVNQAASRTYVLRNAAAYRITLPPAQ